MNWKNGISRRDFINHSSMFFGVLPFITELDLNHDVTNFKEKSLKLNVFSKHLQFLNFKNMAETAKEIGFDGIELTVRRKGHVLPESVAQDLPKAMEAIKNVGSECQMMVTGITELNKLNKEVLQTAAKLGIHYYRLGYYRYPEKMEIPQAMDSFQKKMAELSSFNSTLNITGAYQNHAGIGVGASIWEIWHLLERTEKHAMGCQYDIRHATVEGGASWQNGLKLIRARINSIVLKDFKWKKIDGKWEIFDTPLGEGMVDFVSYFKILKKYKIHVPVAMHFEYDLDGAEHGERNLDLASQQKVFKAMRKDIQFVHDMWNRA